MKQKYFFRPAEANVTPSPAAADEVDQICHGTRGPQGSELHRPSTAPHEGRVDGGQNGPTNADRGQWRGETEQGQPATVAEVFRKKYGINCESYIYIYI